ncbi:MAG: hypothetical protein P1U89_26820 [Verrucomicrobiales bacterium]|nr:hypothetical protein [Verrucomicrobiales bacterium]
MESLEEYRGTDELMPAFERFIQFWASEECDPQPEFSFSVTTLKHTEPIPLELAEYWVIRGRWPQFPLSGPRKGLTLIGVPRYFGFDPPMPAFDVDSRDRDDIPTDRLYLKIAHDWCKCCFHGIHLTADNTWHHLDIEDRRSRSESTGSLENFLIPYGLNNLTFHWRGEPEWGDYYFLRQEATPLWAHGKRTFWYHPDGFLGITDDPFFEGTRTFVAARRVAMLDALTNQS